MKRGIAILIVIVLCATYPQAQSSNKRTRGTSSQSSNIKIPSDLLQQMVRNGQLECGEIIEIGLEKFAAEYLTAEKVDLNRDGQSEFIIEAGGPCFGAHGTWVWIYHNTRGRWEELLSEGGSAQSVNIANTSSKGLRDVILKSATVFDIWTTNYKFDGNRYQPCATKHYARSNVRGKFALKSVERGKCN